MDTVVFDIGNVLVGWDPRRLYAQYIKDEAELDWFLENVVTLEWHTHHDAGRPMQEGIALLSQKYPQYADLIARFDPEWHETILGPIEGSVAILKELAARHVPLYAITNFSAEKFPEFCEIYPWTSLFKDVVVSGAVKLIKPDPAIYQLSMQRFALQKGQALFIDDRMDNVIAAEKEGFIGHHFTTPEKLRAALVDAGLLD